MCCVGEDTAEASVTGVKHRRRAQDKRWGDGVGSGLAVTPDAWAGVTALLGQAPWARMACRDVRQRRTVTSPREGFRCQGVPERRVLLSPTGGLRPLRATDCDVTSRWTVTPPSDAL